MRSVEAKLSQKLASRKLGRNRTKSAIAPGVPIHEPHESGAFELVKGIIDDKYHPSAVSKIIVFRVISADNENMKGGGKGENSTKTVNSQNITRRPRRSPRRGLAPVFDLLAG